MTLGGASLVLVACSGDNGVALGSMGTGGSTGGSGGGNQAGSGGSGGGSAAGGSPGTGGTNGTGGGAQSGGAAGAGDDAGALDDGAAADDGGPRIEAGNPEGMLDGATPCDGNPTDDNLLGPFYRAGAPTRNVIAKPGDGEWLILTGWVKNTRCEALPNALLDAWQSDGVDGMAHYDNTSSAYLFRGKFNADAGGAYKMETILPGHYLNGDTLRVRHIHFKVSHNDARALTTQVEFQGDPVAAVDDISKASLAVPLTKIDGVWRATFNIVLVPGKMTRAPEPRRPSQLTRRSFFGAGRWT